MQKFDLAFCSKFSTSWYQADLSVAKFYLTSSNSTFRVFMLVELSNVHNCKTAGFPAYSLSLLYRYLMEIQ